MNFRLLLMVVFATFLLWVMAAAVKAQEEPPPPYAGLANPFPWSDSSAQKAGMELYQQSCQGCHGADGGNIAASDFSAAGYPGKLEERPDLYFWLLSEGRLDKGMPAYKSSLSEEQRWQVLTYLWSLGAEVTPSEVTRPEVMLPPSKSDTPLDCLSCHSRVLKGHDKLGSGSAACWSCHDSTTIGILRLADGTRLPLADSPPLCGQCHQKSYQAWNEGEHGVVARADGESGVPEAAKIKCISCHNPHQPQMDISAISKLPPAPVSSAQLDCLSCHVRILEGHDKLGSGSEACWACHDNRTMGVLHLANEETRFPLADFSRLCAQCHQKRYQAWSDGTHGAPAWNDGTVEIHGTQRVGCIGCHDPHQPQMVFTNITKPHPLPAPSPPPPSTELLIILGISLLVIIGIGVAVLRKGEGL